MIQHQALQLLHLLSIQFVGWIVLVSLQRVPLLQEAEELDSFVPDLLPCLMALDFELLELGSLLLDDGGALVDYLPLHLINLFLHPLKLLI